MHYPQRFVRYTYCHVMLERHTLCSYCAWFWVEPDDDDDDDDGDGDGDGDD